MRVRIHSPGRGRLSTWACGVILLTTLAGCERGNGEAATPAFVPSWDEARQSLEASLSAWRDAPATMPPSLDIRGVQFVDRKRKPNQRLLSFLILGQTDIENGRQFTVRLNLEGEESPELVKYNLLGRNPVWVFRLDDYEMFAHWEHDMDPPAAVTAEQPKPAEPPAKTK
jgi:hypothetical protein